MFLFETLFGKEIGKFYKNWINSLIRVLTFVQYFLVFRYIVLIYYNNKGIKL